MKPLFHFLILLALACLAGCSRPMDVHAFMAYLDEEAELLQEQEAGGLKVRVRYLPPEQLAIQELGLLESLPEGMTASRFAAKAQEFSHALYFQVQIQDPAGGQVSTRNIQGQEAYQQRLNQLSFAYGNSFGLQYQGKVHRPLHCTYRNTFGNSPDATFVVVFARPAEESESVILTYSDPVWGITQPIAFTYTSQQLYQELPQINLPE